jgi:hypothetical protein
VAEVGLATPHYLPNKSGSVHAGHLPRTIVLCGVRVGCQKVSNLLLMAYHCKSQRATVLLGYPQLKSDNHVCDCHFANMM